MASHMVDTPINRESIQTALKVLNLFIGLKTDVFMAVAEDSLWGLNNAFTNVLINANTHGAKRNQQAGGEGSVGGRQ